MSRTAEVVVPSRLQATPLTDRSGLTVACTPRADAGPARLSDRATVAKATVVTAALLEPLKNFRVTRGILLHSIGDDCDRRARLRGQPDAFFDFWHRPSNRWYPRAPSTARPIDNSVRSDSLQDGVLNRVKFLVEVVRVRVDLVLPDDAPNPETRDRKNQVERVASPLSLVERE